MICSDFSIKTKLRKLRCYCKRIAMPYVTGDLRVLGKRDEREIGTIIAENSSRSCSRGRPYQHEVSKISTEIVVK